LSIDLYNGKGAKTIDVTLKFAGIGWAGSSSWWWKGKIDLINVFDQALTTPERLFLWNDGDGTERLRSPIRQLVGGSLAGNLLVGKGLS